MQLLVSYEAQGFSYFDSSSKPKDQRGGALVLRFYIVDVFAEEKYAGNQLAVFRGSAGMFDSEMQRIAQEMNFAETTFLLSETEQQGGYATRIFTPRRELPFAGHPTLGTVHILRTEVLSSPGDAINLNLKIGAIPVTFVDGIYWMKQMEPVFGEKMEGSDIAPVLGLPPTEIDERFPVQEVSTGLPFILVPLKSLKALQCASVMSDRYRQLFEDRQPKRILVFCPEPHCPENDISVRMFAGHFGNYEDAATGSANGCLAAYLSRYRYWGKEQINIRSEQGFEIDRPSLLYLRAETRAGQIHVTVGGKAVTVAKGEFV